jgi:hypothetical protein
MRTNKLVQQLAGSSWECTHARGGRKATLKLTSKGDAQFPRNGRWGSMNDPTLGESCPVYVEIVVDMASRRG